MLEISRDENEGTDCYIRGDDAKGEITHPDIFSTRLFQREKPGLRFKPCFSVPILFFLLFISWIEDVLVCTRFRVSWRVHAIFVEFYSIVAERVSVSPTNAKFQNRFSLDPLLELFTEPQEGCTTN